MNRGVIVEALVIFFNIPRFEWSGEGPLFELDSNKSRGPKCHLFQIIPWTVIEVRPGALGQVLHPPGNHKWET